MEFLPENFRYGWELEYQNPATQDIAICGLYWGEDGSVDGGEIRLENPMNLADASSALKTLNMYYDFIDDLEIDEEYSFHVHLSYQGVRHFHGIKMQTFMYCYILDNIPKIPTSVLTRWIHSEDVTPDEYDECDELHPEDEKTWLERYFDIKITTDKYCFISFRRCYGTWEFRCFGNIQNAQEGIECMHLATEAFIYARKSIEANIPLPYNDSEDIKRDILNTTIQELNIRSRFTCAAS